NLNRIVRVVKEMHKAAGDMAHQRQVFFDQTVPLRLGPRQPIHAFALRGSDSLLALQRRNILTSVPLPGTESTSISSEKDCIKTRPSPIRSGSEEKLGRRADSRSSMPLP